MTKWELTVLSLWLVRYIYLEELITAEEICDNLQVSFDELQIIISHLLRLGLAKIVDAGQGSNLAVANVITSDLELFGLDVLLYNFSGSEEDHPQSSEEIREVVLQGWEIMEQNDYLATVYAPYQVGKFYDRINGQHLLNEVFLGWFAEDDPFYFRKLLSCPAIYDIFHDLALRQRFSCFNDSQILKLHENFLYYHDVDIKTVTVFAFYLSPPV